MKEKACEMRKRGSSIRDIEAVLGINRSTLSGWFRDITLSEKQKTVLHKKWLESLVRGRQKAVRWHNEQKEKRMLKAQDEARKSLRNLSSRDVSLQELSLAMLYLGEGFKNSAGTGMGNSDPLILNFFIESISGIYGIPRNQFKCWLHLRADQNIKEMKKYWSKELKLPLENFMAASLDQRTLGTKTYPHYKGVCMIQCGTVAIQRKLMYLSRMFCEKVIMGA